MGISFFHHGKLRAYPMCVYLEIVFTLCSVRLVGKNAQDCNLNFIKTSHMVR